MLLYYSETLLGLARIFLVDPKKPLIFEGKKRYKIKSLNGMMILDNNDISNGGLL
jgi:hypothetical protein